jgi:hypothetical protein
LWAVAAAASPVNESAAVIYRQILHEGPGCFLILSPYTDTGGGDRMPKFNKSETTFSHSRGIVAFNSSYSCWLSLSLLKLINLCKIYSIKSFCGNTHAVLPRDVKEKTAFH